MPNKIKITNGNKEGLTKGNISIDTRDYIGPTISHGFFNGINPPVNGYTFYIKKTGIVEDGIVLCLDAGNPTSYNHNIGGNMWYDLSGYGYNFTNNTFAHTTNNGGTFTLIDNTGSKITSSVTTSNNATVVFWIKTTYGQALFLSGDDGPTGGYYLGAYKSSNKEYYGNCGSPTFYMDTINTSNIYDYIKDGEWHMLEFKGVDFSTWQHFKFNDYSNFNFNNGELSSIMIYDREISTSESLQNYNVMKKRFGL